MQKTPLLIGALLLLTGQAIPANAQGFYVDHRFDNRFNNRFDNRFDNRFGGAVNIDRIQARLQSRINMGVARGFITPAEQANLMLRMNNITAAEARLRMDGRLSFNERARLENRLLNLEQAVNRDYFDRQTAGRTHRWW